MAKSIFFFRLPAIFLILLIYSSCQTNSSKIPQTGKTELDGLKVPEGFSIERIVDPKLLSYPMFGSFDDAGRLFVFESDGSTPSTEDMLKKPTYHVRLLQDTDADGIFDKSTIFADSLTFPKGGVFYKGSLYVTSSPDFLRITDTDNDGTGDKREKIHTGWKLDHNGAILGGPFLGPDGYMYLTDARRGFDITTKEGKRLEGKGARIWRCLPDGSGLEPILGGGYDNAIELVFMPSGETIGTMTYFLDPQGGLRDALMHWVEGGVYPKPHQVIEDDKLKMTGDLMPVMTQLARVAPSGLMRYRGTAFGKDFEGNLFSAEFNTGRIMRSKISPDGATFTTVDEPFVTSTIADVHPTDVFEDADGSMILINTGGWFIAGCPLSRVAKLDVPGGIYRLRKNNSAKVDDPWGKKIDLKNANTEQLAGYVLDQRHVVSDRAKEKLTGLGDNAVMAVKNKLLSSGNEEVRAASVFILGRIGSESALKELRSSFGDSSATVRTAAARMAGLAKDKNAIEALKQLVVQKNLAVRRQASTALEQIGDTSAADALLAAAASNNDRYSEHALIHSLISLKNPQPLLSALKNSSAGVRKAAIIALDQMDDYKLQQENIVPFLESDDEQLQKTGIWVALHHPEWGDAVVNYVNKKSGSELQPGDQLNLQNLMIAFSRDPKVQKFIAAQLSDASSKPVKKTFLLNVVTQSPVKKVPAIWIGQLKKLLNSNDVRLKSQVLSVVQSRGVKELNTQLEEIILENSASPDLRVKAIAARLSSDPLLTRREFEVVLQLLDAKNEAPIRQQASRLLSAAELSNAQLLKLAGQITNADVYLLPNIVSAFDGNIDAEVGNALVSSLKNSSAKLENISENDLERILKHYPLLVKKSAEPLMNIIKQKNAARLSQLQSVESSLKNGDIGAGRKLFFGKAICSTCHAINNEGNKFAPDLTNIGEIRSRHDILEAIMFPSASFAREYETSRVITKTNTYTGIIKEQYPDALLIATGPGAATRVQRSDITSIEPGTVSMMPPGLEKQLTQQELSDLAAYLASLPDGAGGTIGY